MERAEATLASKTLWAVAAILLAITKKAMTLRAAMVTAALGATDFEAAGAALVATLDLEELVAAAASRESLLAGGGAGDQGLESCFCLPVFKSAYFTGPCVGHMIEINYRCFFL